MSSLPPLQSSLVPLVPKAPTHNPGSESILPPEIIEEIFLCTAQSHPQTRPVLAITSRWFQNRPAPSFSQLGGPTAYLSLFRRFEPQIYEAVILVWPTTAEKFLVCLASKSYSFLREHVRGLSFSAHIPRDTISQIAQACSWVTHFEIHMNNPLTIPSVAALRPTHVTMRVKASGNGSCDIDPTAPFFSRVTHLRVHTDMRIFGESFLWNRWNWAPAAAPGLTHLDLLMDADAGLDWAMGDQARARVQRVLQEHLNLRLLVLSGFPRASVFGDEPRCVAFKVLPPAYRKRTDFEEMVCGGRDKWIYVDELAGAKRKQIADLSGQQ